MTDHKSAGSTICIDEKLKETDTEVQKAILREWNLLRDYTHSLYQARDPSRTKEDYR